MQCPKCQFENREGAKFCNECGHKFELICPECGGEFLWDASVPEHESYIKPESD